MTTSPVVSITDELLGELRELAEMATPGIWVGMDDPSGEVIVSADCGKLVCEGIDHVHDADFIALANPATILALLAHIDELRTDAARYRWLRSQHWYKSSLAIVCSPKQAVKLGFDCPNMGRLDAAIDAAIAKESP